MCVVINVGFSDLRADSRQDLCDITELIEWLHRLGV
jgi:hypothetical protein